MQDTRTFYLFLGFHSFLIGLFPFFLPVYLVKSGYPLESISLFIGLTGVGFCCCLALWDRMRLHLSFIVTLGLSFVAELLMLLILTLGIDSSLLPVLALINGVYNCLFWTVQRILFYSRVNPKNSGRRFGNFQIFVMILLKSGIFFGGLLLQNIGVGAVFLLSTLTSCAAMVMFLRSPGGHQLPAEIVRQQPIGAGEVLFFTDSFRSRLIFSIDGIFLYLESYFWLISLFLIVHQSFWQLGVLVIILALCFGILFFLIKNRIDAMDQQRVYLVAVVLYGLSWLLRGHVDSDLSANELYGLLVVITFCTSFFRLAFNKRFYDIARLSTGYRYIFFKSYFSQFFLAFFFFSYGLFVQPQGEMELMLRYIYWIAAAAALFYLAYRGGSYNLHGSGLQEN